MEVFSSRGDVPSRTDASRSRWPASALDHVVHLGDHRLLQPDTQLGEDRHKSRPERIEIFLRLPDVEDLDLTVRFERDVEGSPLGSPRTGCIELLDRALILILRESLVYEIDSKCHGAPTLSALAARFVMGCSEASSTGNGCEPGKW